MDATPLTSEDEALVETVGETNENAVDHEFFEGAHVVAAGVRTTDIVRVRRAAERASSDVPSHGAVSQ
jgi:hypothetical protein